MKWYLAAIIMCLTRLAYGQTCDSNANANRVMYYARYNTPGIVVVSAHRGYWEYVPEGTTQSIDAAETFPICSEMVEMDLRMTLDGVVVPGHDWGLERLTTGYGCVYDMPYHNYLKLFLKDRTGKGTNIPVQNLSDYLDKMLQYPNMVLAIDCKDAASAKYGLKPQSEYPTSYAVLRATWAAIIAYEQAHTVALNGKLLRDRIVFKVRYPELPSSPAIVMTDLGITTFDAIYTSQSTHLNILPILYSQDPSQPNYAAIEAAYPTGSFLWFPEAVVNFPGDQLQSYLSNASSSSPIQNVTAFSPSPDWPEGTSMGSGQCCRTRETQFPFVIDPTTTATINSTFTGDFEYLWFQGFHWISTDKVRDAQAYLQARGQRNAAMFDGPNLY